MAEDKAISGLSRAGDTGGPIYIEVVRGSGNYRLKCNPTASAAPTVNDDITAEYSVGSWWMHDGSVYFLKDNTEGAAVWQKYVKPAYDLPLLVGTPAADDLLYMVDKSDTSESAEGTSKAVEAGNIFQSGTWTPTATNVTNDATVTLSAGIYSKVGNVVNFSLICQVEMAVDQRATSFKFNIPVASDFANSSELRAAISGTLYDTATSPISPITRFRISADTTDGVANVESFNGEELAAVYSIQIVGQYLVV